MAAMYLRKYPRVPVTLPVQVTVDHTRPHRARALTLGGGGLFLKISEPLVAGAKLTVRFRPARHLPIVKATSEVRYHLTGEGVGIEFTEIAPEDRQMLLRLILRRIGDKRRHPRRAFVVQVEYEAGSILGFSRDVSVGGMFIDTERPIPVGSTLQLRFHLGDGGPIVVAPAEVRYNVESLGIGVQFVELLPADWSRIDVYVTKGEASVGRPLEGTDST